jgi:predicted nucleic acid-binding protein
MAFLFDTDVLIDISRGSSAAADFVDDLNDDISIARISAMELIIGARDRHDQNVIERFISLFQLIELSEAVGQEAYAQAKRYSKSHGLTVADALIAATATTNDLTLVTRNEKHFRPIRGLRFQRADY